MAADDERVSLRPRGPAGVWRALKWSLLGLKWAFVRDDSFRLELILCAVLVPVALIIGESGVEKALLIAVLLLILVVELMNSALEVVFERYGNDHHALTGVGKDIGSAAVFVADILAAVVWLLVLFG
ncbi:MAG: diacylglycerol kinase [Xanthomonadaceae bacterium]|nr:diacylglycerol kinase [Xanthomonadaceae bacterium]